ncbi:hypothetical protein ANCCEY_04688 [Ancylostoma ceylanicum]|uniref:Uncharacterized protein n=1 Tax=Ancylostoma ceylanicum TaxID=53326 RepID=A0A0D6LVV8_9BILA|nr:hypothetical protein ANCCEY_04688 [Ancylostoma ceylanicum]
MIQAGDPGANCFADKHELIELSRPVSQWRWWKPYGRRGLPEPTDSSDALLSAAQVSITSCKLVEQIKLTTEVVTGRKNVKERDYQNQPTPAMPFSALLKCL